MFVINADCFNKILHFVSAQYLWCEKWPQMATRNVCDYHSNFECTVISFRYNVEEDCWTKVANMHSKRIGVGCTVVNRLLYAVGGFDGQCRLRSVECYHPENNEWLEIKPMKRQRSGAGRSSLNCLYHYNRARTLSV